jgi:hypothetical protein
VALLPEHPAVAERWGRFCVRTHRLRDRRGGHTRQKELVLSVYTAVFGSLIVVITGIWYYQRQKITAFIRNTAEHVALCGKRVGSAIWHFSRKPRVAHRTKQRRQGQWNN